MAAHSFLRLGENFFFAAREGYIPEFAAIFRDDEFSGENRGWANDDGRSYAYVLPAELLKERLDLLGFTPSQARDKVGKVHQELLEQGEEVENFDDWLNEVNASLNDAGKDPDDVPPWVAWNIDPRLVLRLMLDLCPGDLEVSLELSEVVRYGYVKHGRNFCSNAFDEHHGGASLFAPLIVMTEGSTDAEFLSKALQVLSPHLSGYMRFLDYEFRPEGSASVLVKAVRAFAAAGIRNRIVALFDRDSSALEALMGLDEKKLPGNFRVCLLPVLPLASDYPTVGPSGETQMDVNGLAVSLEMFFGEDVLRGVNGQLTPIQWRGFMSKVKKYQGEVMDKTALQNRFRDRADEAIRRGHPLPNEDWSGMELVLAEIRKAFD